MSDIISSLRLQAASTKTLLDVMNESSSGNALLDQVISGHRAEYESTLEKYGVTTSSSSAATNNYKKVDTSTENLLDAINELKEESLYTASEDSKEPYDKSELLKVVTNFATAYNNMVSNLNTVGGTLQTQFLPEMSEAYESQKEQLASIGITIGSDGKMVIDQEKLSAAEPAKIKEIMGSGSSYTTNLSGSLTSIDKIVDTALSYSTKSNGYNNTGSLANNVLSSFNISG